MLFRDEFTFYPYCLEEESDREEVHGFAQAALFLPVQYI